MVVGDSMPRCRPGEAMRIVRYVDRISQWTGDFALWLVVPLMLVVIHEVVARHFFNAPTDWGYDTSWMLYSAQFMIGGAYTLLHKGHIRIDIVYNVLSPRAQLIYDTIIYGVVFFFVMILLTWAGVEFALDAWMSGEKLSTTNWLFPAGPSKTIIPVGFFLLGLQSLAEIVRNIAALGKGRER
jgi:TRAP-type mannitol/chloroaromatic compound transport system permease small subunit